MAMMLTPSRPDSESAAGYARSAAHIFSHDGNNGDVRVHRDVFNHLMCKVLREFAAQRFKRSLRVRLGNDETDVILRRRLRNQQHFGAKLGRG